MDIVDLAYTCRRSHLSVRGYVVAKRDTLHDGLNIDRLRTLPNIKFYGKSPSDLAFVFTGQGAQWAGMGKGLFNEFSVFRQSVRHMNAILKSVPHPPDWSIEGLLFEPAETSRIQHASCARPMATALQVATVDFFASWDGQPKRVVGHSLAEISLFSYWQLLEKITESVIQGHISSTEAITSASYRGYLNGRNNLEGATATVGLGSEEAKPKYYKRT